jgi:hypothetical protein
MKTIYLAGHGRVYYQKTHKVPDGVTLKFVVPDKCTNSGGVSKAVISGASNFTSLTLSAGEEYNEHYLCADIAMIKASKGEAAKKASSKTGKYLLQPRGDNSLKLSRILKFLKGEFPGEDLEVIWTPCRSPINASAESKMLYVSGQVVEQPYTNGKSVTEMPGKETAHRTIRISKDVNTGVLAIGEFTQGNIDKDAFWI